MENLISYLEENKIIFNIKDKKSIIIDNKSFELIYPDEEEGKLFNEDFILITDGTDCDNYIYQFGGKYYWTPNGSEESPQLNKLKYIGKVKEAFPTNCFLGIRGVFELMNGNGLYKDWCQKAKFLEVHTLGICEKNTLAGIMKFQQTCISNNIKAILGATYSVVQSDDLKYDIKLFVINSTGWQNLLMINKNVNVLNQKFIHQKDLFNYLPGLFVVIDPKSLPFDSIPKRFNSTDIYYQLDTVEFEDEEKDKEYLLNLKKYINSSLLPVSITDAFYLDKEDSYIKEKLNTISDKREYKSSNQYFKSKDSYYEELEKLFNSNDDRLFDFFEESIKNENYIGLNCDFNIGTNNKYLPEYLMSGFENKNFESNDDLFWNIIEEGLIKRVEKSKHDLYIDRIQIEYDVISKGGFIDYFLILWDIIRWSRENHILTGIGRGSACGSLIAYCMNITHIDPIEYDLPFERFFNTGRIESGKVPDIDCDFPGERREEVKHYMEQKYGIDQVCSVGTYTTLQLKQGIKDLSRIYGLDINEVNWLTTSLDLEADDIREIFKNALKKPRLMVFIQENSDLINDLILLLKQPKSNSIHACATLIMPNQKDIYNWIPVRRTLSTNKEDVLVSEWEGSELETVGFLKEDILGIKQLDKFQNIISLVKENKNIDIDIYNIPVDDLKVIKYFSKGWNEDTFHFGSKGLTGYCRQMKPENINDLIAAIALYRPGTMESNLHNEYILRKDGDRDVNYEWGTEVITKDTYGIIIFQEQIMKICVAVGGFNLVEADDIRVAMGKKKRAIIDSYKVQFLKGAIDKGCPEGEAIDLWDKLEKFASYSFNKSHAAAYAVTGYISQYLKVHYPIEFWTTAFEMVSSEKRDMKIPQFISEINKTGAIKISPPDINNSFTEMISNFRENTIYWSLTSIKQCGEIAVSQIIEDRNKNGKYFSFDEFLDRHSFKDSKVNKSVIENLVLSGAFDSVEQLKMPFERYSLLKQYRVKNKVKVDKETDLFEKNKDFINEDYWWSLQQKKLSGLAFFDYKDLCEEYIQDGSRYIEQEDFQNETLHYTTLYKTGGYINEVIERKSQKKGLYCSMQIESNFQFIQVTIFPDEYKKLLNAGINLVEETKNIILLSGNIVADTYKKENVIRFNSNSSILILK